MQPARARVDAKTQLEPAGRSRLLGRAVRRVVRSRVSTIGWNALEEFSDDRIPSVAAGITFFFLLALFPAIACVVSIYSLFADRAQIADDVQKLSGFLPGGATTVLEAQLNHLLAQPVEKLGIGFATSFVIAAWSASGGVKALIDGLNVAYEIRDSRSFARLAFHALVLTFAAVLFAAAAIALENVLPGVVAHLPFHPLLKAGVRIAAWPASFIGCTIWCSLVYRYGPDRTSTTWHSITYGSAIASAFWIAGTSLFAWYVEHFGHYDRVYGDLGAIVGFLTWIWLSMLILLLGAEINRAIERRGRRSGG